MKKRSILFLLSLPLLATSGCSKSAEISEMQECGNSTKRYYSTEWDGKPDKRVLALESILNQCRKNGNYILAMTTAYSSNEEFEKAIKYGTGNYDSLSEQEKQDVLRILFMSYAYQDNDKGQQLVIKKAEKEFRSSHVSHLLKGLYNQNLDRWPESILYFEQSNKIHPDYEAFLGLSIGYYNSNRFQESADAYISARRLNPDTINFLTSTLSASASLYELERNEEARKILEDHIAAVPASASDENVIKMTDLLRKK